MRYVVHMLACSSAVLPCCFCGLRADDSELPVMLKQKGVLPWLCSNFRPVYVSECMCVFVYVGVLVGGSSRCPCRVLWEASQPCSDNDQRILLYDIVL
jgi:hypothetical protein